MKTSLIVISFFFFCCQSEPRNPDVKPISIEHQSIKESLIQKSGTTILERFKPPEGFVRTQETENSFQEYLRTLRLKPAGSQVRYHNGATKPNNGIYDAVVDLAIGTKDLHQCADAVMRLQAEYLWKQKRYDQIHFNFTNGFQVDYSKWMSGNRIKIHGNETTWINKVSPSNTYEDFWNYLETIFMYAGTASLEKELISADINDAEIGDVLIQGGYPGHAVIIVDKAMNQKTGERLYLIAQSYMPAQEIQILKNPENENSSPWFELNAGVIRTPEWSFNSKNLKRFSD